MRILMLLEKEFPHDVRVEKEIDTLIRAGHTLSIATISHRQYFEKEEILDNGCNVFRRKISKFVFKSSVGCLKFPFYFNFWRKYIHNILTHNDFDAIHVHDLPLAIIGFEAKQKHNLHFVLDLHENWPAAMDMAHHTHTFLGRLLSSSKLWRRYERKMVQLADAVIVVIKEMGDRIMALDVDDSKLFIVENTLTTSVLKNNEGKPDSEFLTLFYSGGINMHRGLQVVISALPIVVEKFPNVRLWIAGAGSYVKNLKQLVKRLELDKFVVFKGHMPYNDVFNLLLQSDVALIPHLKSEQTDNSSPNKLYEYMLVNKPILASNCNSVQRIVEGEKIGITYEHDNPNDFAQKLSQLIDNKSMFNNGFEVLNARYLWSFTKRNLLQLYAKLSKIKTTK